MVIQTGRQALVADVASDHVESIMDKGAYVRIFAKYSHIIYGLAAGSFIFLFSFKS